MTEERSRLDTLPARFPRLFANSNLIWGLQISAGWTTIVEDMCQKIDFLLQAAPDAEFEVIQVKEKFAALCFYYRLNGAPDQVLEAVRQVVDATERASTETCELCGALGQLTVRNYWMSTRCSRCSVS